VTNDHTWAVGTFVNLSTDNNETLVLRSDLDGSWHALDAGNPGSGSNILAGVASQGDTVWATGVFDNGARVRPLVEMRPRS